MGYLVFSDGRRFSASSPHISCLIRHMGLHMFLLFPGCILCLVCMETHKHKFWNIVYGRTLLAVYATCNVSGGHLNPAVSFANCLTGHMSWSKGGVYVTAQVLGAIFGALVEAKSPHFCISESEIQMPLAKKDGCIRSINRVYSLSFVWNAVRTPSDVNCFLISILKIILIEDESDVLHLCRVC